MKTLLFIAALPSELKVAKTFWKEYKKKSPLQADFLSTWIGNLNMTLELSKKLSSKNYDFVINFWVCGYKETQESCIQVIRSIYAPTKKEILTPVFFEFAPLESILCSEVPVTESSTLWEENLVDMESYSFEKVCEDFRLPRIILKVPVDRVWRETLCFEKQTALRLLSENIDFSKLIEKIEVYLASLEDTYDLSIYTKHYLFTASEVILFKKLFLGFQNLSEESFEDFFLFHKKLWKKDFLQKLGSHIQTLKKI